jgi:hypothetical protein
MQMLKHYHPNGVFRKVKCEEKLFTQNAQQALGRRNGEDVVSSKFNVQTEPQSAAPII